MSQFALSALAHSSVDRVAQNLLDSVFALPLADQLELVDRLLERLHDERLPVSEGHRRLLDERFEECKHDPEEGLPWAEVKSQILAHLDGR